MHSMAWEVIRHSGPDWREAYQFWLFLRSSLWGDGELSCDELRCLNDLGKLRSRHHAASYVTVEYFICLAMYGHELFISDI